MSPYQIIIADDHAVLRKGIKKILEEDPDLEKPSSPAATPTTPSCQSFTNMVSPGF
jgi:DNA-binding NarL/FixJ family response regulator